MSSVEKDNHTSSVYACEIAAWSSTASARSSPGHTSDEPFTCVCSNATRLGAGAALYLVSLHCSHVKRAATHSRNCVRHSLSLISHFCSKSLWYAGGLSTYAATM